MMDKLNGCIFWLPVYDKNYLKTKIKSHEDEVRDFYDKKFLG